MTDNGKKNQFFLARATKRLNREMRLIFGDPIHAIDVKLNEDDILDWHFVIHGRESTLYHSGVYHGRLVFPPTYPFSPPKILFLTPNGRFKVNERICFSLSDFHPLEWKPAYSVSAVLRGVYDFMHETTDTIGSIDSTDKERRRLARESMEYNRNCASFCTFFPHLCVKETQNVVNQFNSKSFVTQSLTDYVVGSKYEYKVSEANLSPPKRSYPRLRLLGLGCCCSVYFLILTFAYAILLLYLLIILTIMK